MTRPEPKPTNGCAAWALVVGLLCGALAALVLAGDVSSDPASRSVQMMWNSALLIVLVPTSAILIAAGARGIVLSKMAPSVSRARPRRIKAVVVLLEAVGVVGIAIASLMFLASYDVPDAAAAGALGIGGLVAAGGIRATAPWARSLGIGVCLAGIVLSLLGFVPIWTIALIVPALWILFRRWPVER